MVFEPGIQVNPVIDAAPPQANVGHIQLRQEGDADPQIDRRLLLGQAAHRGQGQAFVFHEPPYSPREARR